MERSLFWHVPVFSNVFCKVFSGNSLVLYLMLYKCSSTFVVKNRMLLAKIFDVGKLNLMFSVV